MDDGITLVSLLLFAVNYPNHGKINKISLSPQIPMGSCMVIKDIDGGYKQEQKKEKIGKGEKRVSDHEKNLP